MHLLNESSTLELTVIYLVQDSPLYAFGEISDHIANAVGNYIYNELSEPSQSAGFLSISCSIESLLKNLPFYQKIHVNGYWMFITINVNLIEIKNFLELAWTEYKMLHIILINFESSTNELMAYLWSPFQYPEMPFKVFLLNSTDATKSVMKNVRLRATNLNGHPLVVDITELPMYAEPIYNDKGQVVRYVLREGEALYLFSFTMNFTTKFSNLSKNNHYLEKSGIDLVEGGYVDFSARLRPWQRTGFNNTVFLYPIGRATLKYAVPRVDYVPSISIGGFGLFGPATIATIYALVIICSIFRHLIQNFERKLSISQGGNDFTRSLIQMVGFTMAISQPISRTTWVERIPIACALMIYLVAGISYQGRIMWILRIKENDNQLNTLSSLLESGMPLVSFTDTGEAFKFKTLMDITSIRGQLYFRQERGVPGLERPEDTCGLLKQGRKFGYLSRNLLHIFVRLTCFNNNTGDDILHVIPEPLISIYLAQTIPRTSPFIYTFNRKIHEIAQAGFLEYAGDQEDWITFKLMVQRYRNVTANTQLDEVPIKVENLYIPFMFLLYSWAMSAVIFLMEVFHIKIERIYKFLFGKFKFYFKKQVIK